MIRGIVGLVGSWGLSKVFLAVVLVLSGVFLSVGQVRFNGSNERRGWIGVGWGSQRYGIGIGFRFWREESLTLTAFFDVDTFRGRGGQRVGGLAPLPSTGHDKELSGEGKAKRRKVVESACKRWGSAAMLGRGPTAVIREGTAVFAELTWGLWSPLGYSRQIRLINHARWRSDPSNHGRVGGCRCHDLGTVALLFWLTNRRVANRWVQLDEVETSC